MKHLLPLFTVFLIIFVFTIETVDAQKYRRWNRYKKEFGLSLGGTLLAGDLGGTDGIRGINLKNSGMTYGGFFKYRFHDRFAAKGSVMLGNFYSSDWSSTPEYREAHGIKRRLDAKTRFSEFSGQVEFYILEEKIGSRYKVRGVKGYGQSAFALYVFAGIGANVFNTQGHNYLTGEWVKLRPLHTEGQGLPNGPKQYSNVTVIFPMGAGIKYNFNREWGVQLEGSYRWTTTDYLDDVGGKYYDSDILEAEYGTESRFMATKGNKDARAGGIRGGKANDLYMTGTITVTYRLKSKARSRVRL